MQIKNHVFHVKVLPVKALENCEYTNSNISTWLYDCHNSRLTFPRKSGAMSFRCSSRGILNSATMKVTTSSLAIRAL